MIKSLGKQRGLNLIELMIAILIGVFISLMVVQYLVTSSRIFKRQGADTNLEQNAGFAISYLSEYIRQAGTRTDFGTVVPFYIGGCDPLMVCSNDGNGLTSATDPATSDTIAVQMRPSSGLDCTGGDIPQGNVVANVFYVGTSTTAGINSLYCRGYDVTDDAWLGAQLAIIDGIDQMQILYGVADASDRVVNYVDAARVPAISGNLVAGWDRVKAVKIALLVSDGYDSGTENSASRSFQLFDGPSLSINDNTSRRVFSTTVTINNKIL